MSCIDLQLVTIGIVILSIADIIRIGPGNGNALSVGAVISVSVGHG